MRIVIISIVLCALLGCKTTPTMKPAEEIKFDLCKNKENKPITRDVAENIVRIWPKYPQYAEDNKINGYLKFKFYLSASGATERIEIIESSPKGVFDEEGLKALKKWKYLPKCNNGVVVPEPIEMTWPFSIS